MATEPETIPSPSAAPWEPRIVALLCTWCSYAGADLAGSSRIHYPSNVRIIRVPCSGRIDPLYVLRAFERGADAVLVAGCHPGDCHYAEGNFYARRRMLILNQLLQFVGVPSERFWFRWVSAAEGPEFAHLIDEITEKVRPLGPHKPELADKFVVLDEIVHMLESVPEGESCPDHASSIPDERNPHDSDPPSTRPQPGTGAETSPEK